MKRALLSAAAIIILIASGCAGRQAALKPNSPGAYCVKGKTYVPLKEVAKGFSQKGVASWYGPGFDGKKTSSGEVYDMYALTAAHTTLPLHTLVKVTNLNNQKDIVVRINDRGPFVGDRVIDLSLSAAHALGMVTPGTAPVRIAVLGSSGPILASAREVGEPKDRARRVPNPFYGPSTGKLLALSRN
jgi:rare lipoprotein A